jgi:hypothetical protein
MRAAAGPAIDGAAALQADNTIDRARNTPITAAFFVFPIVIQESSLHLPEGLRASGLVTPFGVSLKSVWTTGWKSVIIPS